MVVRVPFGRDKTELVFLCHMRITDWGRGFKTAKAAKKGWFSAGSGRGDRNIKRAAGKMAAH
jgi:hypothetical protein